jgi:hypothetical protein
MPSKVHPLLIAKIKVIMRKLKGSLAEQQRKGYFATPLF